MSVLFSHTMRGIRSYSPRYINFAKVLALMILFVWGYWFFFSRVKVYEISETADLMLSPGPFSVESATSGRLLTYSVPLGDRVEAGEVLAELDTTSARLELKEVTAELQLLEGQVSSLDRELEILQGFDALSLERERLLVEEERSNVRRTEVAAGLAEREQELMEKLFKQGMASEVEILRAEARVSGTEAELSAGRVGVERTQRDIAAQARRREGLTAAHMRIRKEKSGRMEVLRARAESLEHRIEQGRIRTSVAGTVASAPELTPGAYVEQGRRVAVILPRGRLHAQAWFKSSRALGKIFVDQTALVKLDGFPWTRYGGIRAKVAKVGAQPEDGLIRVDLTLDDLDTGRAYLRHGLPGTVEIVVDELTPADLLMHMLGKGLREEHLP